jgi:PAS domain S-box-containing protein
VLHAPDTSILLANAQASAMLGLSLDQMRGKVAIDPAWRFVREDLTTMPVEEYPVARVLATSAPVVNQVIGADRPATGDLAWALVNAYPVFRGSGELLHVVVTFVDITQRRALEAQLAMTSRLATLGTLVAGVAHEINNPLTSEMADQGMALEVVREVRERLHGDLPVDRRAEGHALDGVVEALEDAQESGARIAQIVKDLSVFGRPDVKRQRVRLMDVIDGAMRWLPSTVARSASIQVENGGAPDVIVSVGQVEQILVNLVTNAAKATPEGQHDTIIVRVGPGLPGMARVEVIDHGIGVDPAIRDHIFDPFFTTRPAGPRRGSGLGLAICQSIVTAHGGTLTVESEVGKGSTFRLELPATPVEA